MARTAGTVYLLHLDAPFRHATHYIGWAADLEARLHEHRAGTVRSARMLRAAKAVGIGFTLARTWPGGRTEERRIKRMRMAPRLCPTCRANPGRERRAPGGGPWPVGATP